VHYYVNSVAMLIVSVNERLHPGVLEAYILQRTVYSWNLKKFTLHMLSPSFILQPALLCSVNDVRTF
jgi:hypothetical protein